MTNPTRAPEDGAEITLTLPRYFVQSLYELAVSGALATEQAYYMVSPDTVALIKSLEAALAAEPTGGADSLEGVPEPIVAFLVRYFDVKDTAEGITFEDWDVSGESDWGAMTAVFDGLPENIYCAIGNRYDQEQRAMQAARSGEGR